jgi:signal transduction histidine kinase
MRGVISSFKTRLTVTMAAVVVAAGAALAVGQLLVLDAAVNRNVGQVTVGNSASSPPDVGSPGPVDEACAGTPPTGAGTGGCRPAVRLPAGQPTGGTMAERNSLAWAILRDTAMGSVALLLGFAAVAAVLAWWLTRRAMHRVAEVTSLARAISEHDLSRRLNLPGPGDEIKELADTIDVMLARLQAAFDSQERFVANASHELRGPLTASRTALEAPLTQGRFPIEVQASVLRALEANRRSERLITALLQLARSQALPDAQQVGCDLAGITSAMVEALAEDAAARDVRVELEAAGPVPVTGHRTLLAQAVFNLLDNAVGHNQDHGCVRVTVSGAADSAVLCIENSGAVYTQPQADQLREPFHRGTRTRLTSNGTQAGLGLGLALVDSIARAHRGSLEIAARPGGGLSVRLVLPRGASERASAPPASGGLDATA